MTSGHKPVKQEFNLRDEIVLVSGEGAMSMDHANNSASKNARCVAGCGWKVKAKILTFFKDLCDDTSGRDGCG